jgi:hypothetical protein
MTTQSTRLVLGCVAIIAAAGATAYVATDWQAREPTAKTGQVTLALQTAAPRTFEPLVQNFSLLRDSAAYVSASPDAPQLYPLLAGTGLVSASKSSDGAWIIAMTQDGQAAYIPAADLGPYDPAHAPLAAATPASPDQVAGPAHVVNTATLQIGDKTISLAGLQGKMGKFASQLQSYIDAHAPITCVPHDAAYSCTLADGTDVGQMAVSAGLAETADDAGAEYQQQEAAAREAHLGLWK